MSTPEQKAAIEAAVAEAIQHLRESGDSLGAALSVEVENLADIARDTAAEVILGTLSADAAEKNLRRLSDALQSVILANGYAEQARQVAWFKAWAVGLLKIAAATV